MSDDLERGCSLCRKVSLFQGLLRLRQAVAVCHSAFALETSQRAAKYQCWPQRGRNIMNTQELAKTFTDMCAKGEFDAAGKEFWSDDIVSREPMTGDMAVLKGRKAVEGKGEWWYANHEV